MSDPFHHSPMPRAPLLAAAALVLLTIVGAGWSRYTGEGRPTRPDSPATQVRELRFEDRSDGGVSVVDAKTGLVSQVLSPGQDGFIRATMRTFARERRRRDIGPEVPFRLSLHTDGRLTLEDPTIERRVDLEAFGPTNAGAFARLLTDKKETMQ